MKLCLHSYTFRDYEIDHALRKAAQYGWDGLELHSRHFDESNLRNALSTVIEKAVRHGVDITVLDFSANFIQDDASQLTHNIEKIKGMLPTARDFGIQIVNGTVGTLVGTERTDFGKNGSALATEEHYERAADALRQIMPIAETEGITITLEIHMNTIHDTAAATLKLLDMVGSPALKANLDPGNMHATATAEDPITAIGTLQGKLGLCHAKNCVQKDDGFSFSILLESGEIDFYKTFAALKNSGYAGPIVIEYCGRGDPNVAARRDVEYARRTLADITLTDTKQEKPT